MSSAILDLPWNVLLKILENLSRSDMRSVMLTCRFLHEFVVNENSLWRSLNRNKIIIGNSSDNRKTLRSLFYHQCRVSHNWVAGYYCKKMLITHRINYMPWLKYHDSEALLVSIGSQLWCHPNNKLGFPNCRETMWKLNVPTVARNDVRTNDISRFIVRDNYLACGNRDGSVALYRMDSIRRTPCLVRHIKDCHDHGRVEVSAVELITIGERERVITASECSPQIRFWEGEPKDNVDTSEDVRMIPDCIGVRCMATNRTELLALGPNGNSKPLLLNINTGQILIRPAKKEDRKDVVRDIIWHDSNSITCVTHSGLLQTLDIRTGQVVHCMWDPFRASLYCVRSDGERALVLGASQYSRCVLFDMRATAHHLQLYFTQKKASPVYSLDFDSRKLIAAADRSIAALDFDVYPSEAEHFDYSYAFWDSSTPRPNS